jgi:hypothetical protein
MRSPQGQSPVTITIDGWSAINLGPNAWISWIFVAFMVWLLLIQIRYIVRQVRSAGWPVIDATMQKGPTGFVPFGRGEGIPAFFVGYTFLVGGEIYTGIFALYGNSDDVDRVRKNFPGGLIRVRYKPTDPRVSFLRELNDPRFVRLTATQNPQHLSKVPSFDLQDAIRK